MEKLIEKVYKEINEEVCYDNFTGRFNIHESLDVVGWLFCYGTSLGFPYHLIRGKGAGGGGFICRLHGAAMKSSRVGGFCALLGVCMDVIAYPVCKLRGEGILNHPGDIVACGAASGALLQAHRGLVRASGTALAVGGLCASFIALETRYKPKRSEINTYSYPHYRPPQHRLHNLLMSITRS